MVDYNPEVLRKWAGRLYRQAYTSILLYTIGFLMIGFVLIEYDIYIIDPLITLILLVAIGGGIGLYKTLEKRAKAQRDLCLILIENHLETLTNINRNIIDKKKSIKTFRNHPDTLQEEDSFYVKRRP